MLLACAQAERWCARACRRVAGGGVYEAVPPAEAAAPAPGGRWRAAPFAGVRLALKPRLSSPFGARPPRARTPVQAAARRMRLARREAYVARLWADGAVDFALDCAQTGRVVD